MPKTTAFPLKFLARMAALLDEEFPPFLVALNQAPVPGLRVNRLKLAPEQFQALSPWPLSPVPWCPDGFILDRKANAGMHPLHEAGLYYIQEPSAMAVATLLAPQPGERVLDLCASPGGKATHLAAQLGHQGLLVANEIERSRVDTLRYNLERWGTRNALVLNETPERLAQRWPEAFDRVLVDAPCSGEGMFRKKEEARFHWTEAHVAGCALRQRDILDVAARLVRPGGSLAYATCTFAPEEDEGVIWRFLQGHPDFELEELPAWPGLSTGHPDWAEWPQAELRIPADQQINAREETGGGLAHGQQDVAAEAERSPARHSDAGVLRRTVRLWPHKVQGEGHFVAILRRAGDKPAAAWQPARPARLSAVERGLIEEFWEPLISLPQPERFVLRQRDAQVAEVFALPADMPDTEGLRTPRPGWHLGTLRMGAARAGARRGRFEPSYAFALGLQSGEVCERLDEPIGSELIARFLRGEALPVPGPDGWLMVCVEGFPLGWGKRSGDVIKNHYPKSLRWP